MRRLTADAKVGEVADILTAHGWEITLRSVPGRRLRAVVLSDGREVASRVAADYAAALVGAVNEALHTASTTSRSLS